MGAKIGGLIAAAVVVLGAFLPWASVSAFGYSETLSGVGDGRDGWITLIGALVAGALIAVWKRGTVIAAGVVSILVFLTGLYDLIDIQRTAGDLGELVDASAGIGLYLTVLAALTMAVLAFIGQAGIAKAPTAFAGAPYGLGQAPAWGQPTAQPAQPAWGQAPAQATQPAWGQTPAQATQPEWGQAPAQYAQPAQPVQAQPVQQPYQQPVQAQPAQQPVQQQPQAAAAAPAGWHPDPYGQAQLRYWDGTRWTEHTHNQ